MSDFGCWLVYCIHCSWISETCRDQDTLVAAHRIHTEHLLAMTGANRELTSGEMAAMLPEDKQSAYWDRQIGRYFVAALDGPNSPLIVGSRPIVPGTATVELHQDGPDE